MIMDLHALLAPLIRPLVSSSSSDAGLGAGGPSNSAATPALDRTIGAAATLGLSLAVYRLVSAALRDRREEGGDDNGDGEGIAEREAAANAGGGKAAGILALPAFLLSFLRIILQGAIFRRIEDGGGRGGDSYHRAAYGAATLSKSGGDGPEVQHCGSCHCGSICFTLNAPRHIRAVDCKGKIRYPHYRTAADKFQLTKGSKHLKMYYVTVSSCDDDRGNGSSGGGDDDDGSGAEMKKAMAAHTFCSRCGVNILRAPDSNLDALEVNVGCLDADGATVGVSFYDGRLGLAAGTPLQNQWTADENATHFDDATCSPLHVDDISTFWPTEPEPSPDASHAPNMMTTPPASYDHPNGGKPASGMPDTPSTSATTMSDSLPLPSRVVVSHRMSSSVEDLESSVDSAEDLTVSVGGGLSVIGEGVSVREPEGSWAVGASLRPSPREAVLPPRPTTVNRDQLKYYMRRHLSTPSPSSSSVSDSR